MSTVGPAGDELSLAAADDAVRARAATVAQKARGWRRSR